ncbi:MAG: sigma-70 family RNA polymerase sigma factor [bacterium]|nr:sigma-70 family RNA polymerase sigma factor [bacterium]MCM1376411.1 sigma-70 family RNA polymerase sigma factor [Muribaculum sp.]
MKNTQYFAFEADIINRNGLFDMDTIMIQDVIRIQDKLQEKIDSYSDMLYKIAFARMGNRADAEDVVQETFYQYFRHSRVFDNEEHEKAWLIRVTLNGCRKVWRSGFYRRRSELPEHEQMLGDESQDPGEGSPEEAFLDKEKSQAVLEAVWRLPATYREVIHLFYYEELSVKEIAAILGRKVPTVTSQLTRGRELLKKSLREEYDFA